MAMMPRAVGSAFAGFTRIPAMTPKTSVPSSCCRARPRLLGPPLALVPAPWQRRPAVENGKAQAACFPFCAMNPNIGVVAIADARQHVISKFGKSQQMTPTSIELVYIADDDIVHVNGKVDPKSDIDIEKRLDKLKDQNKRPTSKGEAQEQADKSGLEKIQTVLMNGKPTRSVELADHEN
ncbi:hypothetical protein GUJ93_ZPchr0013g34473 [Zizania palustris]|uniref:Uncharacterized protein n=1 Tax=Zizania palustris TaxID=103762 RepID=A0A8J6BZT5_ZIZPA|nr:hypothetical protein GUJ93_ZPchr0013g34473 [Zizania palustris]